MAPLVGVVTNPHSKKNHADPERMRRVEREVGDLGLVRRTASTAEVASVVREFLDAGIPWWVADGGDGAFHWVANAAWQETRRRGVPMPAILPANGGNMNFLGRKCGVHGRTDVLVAALCRQLRGGHEPAVVRVRSMVVTGRTRDGAGFERIGFASALAGVGQQFFGKYYASRDLGSLAILQVIAHLLGSMAALAPGLNRLRALDGLRRYGEGVFDTVPLDVWVDGEAVPFGDFRTVNVGAVDINLGGVVRLFPYAREPGVLHVQAGSPTLPETLANLPRVMLGKPLQARRMVDRPADRLRLVARAGSLEPVIDGELFPGLVELDVGHGPEVSVVQVAA